jgi:cytochrome c553
MVRRDRNKYERELGRRSAAKLLTQDEARRIAANIAKLPETAANPSGPHLTSLTPIPGTLASER